MSATKEPPASFLVTDGENSPAQMLLGEVEDHPELRRLGFHVDGYVYYNSIIGFN